MTTSEDVQSPSPTLVAFLSGLVSVLLTLVGTLYAQRSILGTAQYILLLLWAVYVLAGVLLVVLFWSIGLGIRTRLRERENTYDLRDHLAKGLVIKSQTSRVEVDLDGSCEVEWLIEVETSGESTAPWLTIPVGSGVTEKIDRWKSVEIRSVQVDGTRYSPASVMRPYATRTLHFQDPKIEFEEWSLRIPIALTQDKRRARIFIQATYLTALCDIRNSDYWYVEVLLVTKRVSLEIRGKDGLQILPSAQSAHYINARGLREDNVDPVESQEQSRSCQVTRNGVLWETSTAKVAYRYEIALRGEIQERGD
jgi:hypothetical protein